MIADRGQRELSHIWWYSLYQKACRYKGQQAQVATGILTLTMKEVIKLSEETKKTDLCVEQRDHSHRNSWPKKSHDNTINNREVLKTRPQETLKFRKWEKCWYLWHKWNKWPKTQQYKKSPEKKECSVTEMLHSFTPRQPRGSGLVYHITMWINFNNKVRERPVGWDREIKQVLNLSICSTCWIIKSYFPPYSVRK